MNNSNEFYLGDAIEVIEEVLASGGEFKLSPKGTSMLPLLLQGRDSVILRAPKEKKLKKNDIAFYRRSNGQFVLHRVMSVKKDGSYTMCGDNQTTLEHGIREEQIIAYVERFYKGDKEVNQSSLKYRLYLLFWCSIPSRRALIFMGRCTRKIKRICLSLFSKNA